MGTAITVGLAEITNEPHRTPGGPLDDLIAALEGGAQFKLLVTRTPSGRLQLLSGERRFEAMLRQGIEKARVYVIHDLAGLNGWLTLDAKDPYRTPMTRSEVGRFSVKAQQQLRLSGKRIGYVDEMLGEIEGYGRQTVQDMRLLVNRVNGLGPGPEQNLIIRDIAQVDLGLIKPNSAIGRDVARRKAALIAAAAPPAPEQTKTLIRIMPTLRGITEALQSVGPISADVPDNVRRQAEKELRTAGRLLAAIARTLRDARESES